MSETVFERGDLLLVAFPFTDFVGHEATPGFRAHRFDGYGDFIALPITSRPQAEHGLPLTGSDLLDGRLPAPS